MSMKTEPEISLIVKEMQAQNITINGDGMTEIHSWDVVRPKAGYPKFTTEKKTEAPITDPRHILGIQVKGALILLRRLQIDILCILKQRGQLALSQAQHAIRKDLLVIKGRHM